MGCRKNKALSISLIILALALLSIAAEASREYLVGGKADAWNTPSISASDSLNQWAQNSRFQVGDYLVWKYDSKKNSVLQVTREAYLSCNTAAPIEEHKDGDTKVKLDHAGPYYFISGAEGHCDRGQKLIVLVMAPRQQQRQQHMLIMAPSPSPSPSQLDFSATTGVAAPAPAPVSAAAVLRGCPMMLATAFGAAVALFLI